MATILVVDDDELMRSSLAFTLSAEGYEVLEARDGQEVLELFAQQPDAIDLVVSDLRMPRLNGIEMLQILKSMRPEVKVILMTGFPSDAQAWLAQGGYDCLTKPIDIEKLLSKIAAALVSLHRVIALDTSSGIVRYPIAIIEDTAELQSWFVQVDTTDSLTEDVYPAVLEGGVRDIPGQYTVVNAEVTELSHALRGIFQVAPST
jgi:CheY-like chemotaxis protein